MCNFYLIMDKDESDSPDEFLESCTFCSIATGADEEATVMMKSKKLMCFKDIYPAAPHHYLVVPIGHIKSCHSLKRRHINLVEQMIEMGKTVLHDQGIVDMSDIRLGFHQPPFTSVGHLHLHVLAPASQISKYMAYKFIPKSSRFVTGEHVLRHLKNLPSLAPYACTCY